MDDDLWIAEAILSAPAASLEALRAAVPRGPQPFHHLALLVPGDRYDAAREWAAATTGLLHRPDETSTTFAFPAWDALACYFHDPVGNIVELIAHRAIGETGRTGRFGAGELTAISEVGLVVSDPPAAAATLACTGLELWSGDTAGDEALAFVGRQAHTLILTSRARPWLPTHRPAESHPAAVVVRDGAGHEVRVALDGGTVAAR